MGVTAVTARELVIEQINHHETNPIPVTISLEAELAARIDEHTGSTEWRKRIGNDILIVWPLDASKYVQVDDKHHKDGFGNLWRTDLLPRHLEVPALSSPTLQDYAWPASQTFLDQDRYTHAQSVCKNHRDKFIIANIGWGLFERTWTLRGFTNVLMDSIAEPDFYEELLDRIVELQLDFINQCVTLDIDGIMFSDDWGDQRGVILGPDRWRSLIKPRIARLYDAVHKHGLYTLSHCCGNVADIISDLVEVGLDVLESVQPEAMNPYELKRRWGKHITFWGGLGSQSTLAFSNPSAVRDEVKRLSTEMSQGGGYILAPAKALMNSMPLDNAIAAVDAFYEVRMGTTKDA
jgi:uroporphyrinogen decarboxylase